MDGHWRGMVTDRGTNCRGWLFAGDCLLWGMATFRGIAIYLQGMTSCRGLLLAVDGLLWGNGYLHGVGYTCSGNTTDRVKAR